MSDSERKEASRLDLCDEALRLGAILAELMPTEGEVLGLLALMELQASRAATRADTDGNLVLLADQDRSRWDRARIARSRRSTRSMRQRCAATIFCPARGRTFSAGSGGGRRPSSNTAGRSPSPRTRASERSTPRDSPRARPVGSEMRSPREPGTIMTGGSDVPWRMRTHIEDIVDGGDIT